MLHWCTHCNEQRTMAGVEKVFAKNGQPMVKGRCVTCGTKMGKFLSRSKE